MASYTGSLLTATSTPLWSVAERWLPALFGVSGTATAAAALTLATQRVPGAGSSMRRLERLALLASLEELGLTLGLDRHWRRTGVRAALDERPLRWGYQVGAIGLGVLAPLLVHALQALTGRELTTAGRIASVAAIVGGYSQRATLIFAGKASAERPEDYFGVAQP